VVNYARRASSATRRCFSTCPASTACASIQGQHGAGHRGLHPRRPRHKEGETIIEQSREAYDDLFKLIREAVDVGEKVELEIA
jgi:hypothetical protein